MSEHTYSINCGCPAWLSGLKLERSGSSLRTDLLHALSETYWLFWNGKCSVTSSQVRTDARFGAVAWTSPSLLGVGFARSTFFYCFPRTTHLFSVFSVKSLSNSGCIHVEVFIGKIFMVGFMGTKTGEGTHILKKNLTYLSAKKNNLAKLFSSYLIPILKLWQLPPEIVF